MYVVRPRSPAPGKEAAARRLCALRLPCPEDNVTVLEEFSDTEPSKDAWWSELQRVRDTPRTVHRPTDCSRREIKEAQDKVNLVVFCFILFWKGDDGVTSNHRLTFHISLSPPQTYLLSGPGLIGPKFGFGAGFSSFLPIVFPSCLAFFSTSSFSCLPRSRISRAFRHPQKVRARMRRGVRALSALHCEEPIELHSLTVVVV
jgi:hypothetical protein